ncbi:alpha/beta fold hydrolase [Mycolicibacterium monacense]|uniref:Hydrolase n=1 Tax=Mycolicibacterium monacense TaxID=85693 RepID=A0AAD1IZ96_MYCMB|nr:alpha/beta hydrolase [Mycolicibacterium monacense]MDA4101849.1 hydrolase [Mycolicibacterium monacense DSM 44395]ORB12226.1 alpha/beta hydrolase [Mycolicibacterium monacense DSM 44395]QHP84789.1 alpha/beta hydrolase [Mycolicibacterium monacense DSM 44395]BBZ62402.1 hydrolase [Mycolicibacterium monacense]
MQIREGKAPSGEKVQIHYEDMGDPNHPAVLLIMGLGAQLTFWREDFCRKLVDQGLRVIRYDNRDVGLSTYFDGQRTKGSQIGNMARSLVGRPSPALYTLEDMADDAAALLDHLDIDSAHVVGGSMGGMIAQIVAARHAERTKTLGVIFSSNNQAFLPPPGPRHLLAVITGPSPNSPREVIIENSIKVSKIIGSPAYPKSEDALRADAMAFYDRAFNPVGVARQFNAITGTGSLRKYNKQTKAPTVVIHGKADKLMRPTGGKAIAKAIPNARLVLFDGMGHELPEPLWDDIVGELKTTFAERP